ncbi:MAG: serine/threonine-protein phosphatase [Hormoscilla sp. GM102CHS1]|nr:serine/threonine-protein phosphatase [Hormoscilla sp. GM102CHS1]
MKRFFKGLTDTGVVRSVNQDHYYCDSEGRFFIVADGMGGHTGGQEASHIATETIKNYLQEKWSSDDASPKLLEEALKKANRAILLDQQQHPERSDMGTTIVVLMFREDQHRPWCAHIGDSRLYRLRGHGLEQITEDHTWVACAVSSGALSPDLARTHPYRHVLSQCLGRDDLGEIEVQSLDVQAGDLLLICSDGLTEELSDHQIESKLKTIRASEKAAQTLIDTAKDKGGWDNITVVIVAISDASY